MIYPLPDCPKCPRLCLFREQNKIKFPTYHNGPVESFGDVSAPILVVGLAPGLNGANQTNRPFTNDYAGDILYPALKQAGFAKGTYLKKKDDGFELINVRVTNAVRCVPPQNKVTSEETTACMEFLASEVQFMPNLKIILSLGAVSHNAVLKMFGYKLSEFKFTHGAVHRLYKNNLYLVDSYHTSRYNINTGVLTQEMFQNVVFQVKALL